MKGAKVVPFSFCVRAAKGLLKAGRNLKWLPPVSICYDDIFIAIIWRPDLFEFA